MSNDIQNVLWLQENEILGNKLELIRSKLTNKFVAPESSQCIHDKEHCQRIENAIHHLVPGEHYQSLKDEERFFLLASPWILYFTWDRQPNEGHHGPYTDKDRRERAIQELNDPKTQELLTLSKEESRVFQYMIDFHALYKNLEECSQRLEVEKSYINVRLLTAYLRLADAKHVDQCGGPKKLFYFLHDPNSPELFHWLKSKMYLEIQAEPERNEIHIHLDSNITLSQNIVDAIQKGLQLVVDSVKNILVIGGITKYLSVKVTRMEMPSPTPDERHTLEQLSMEYKIAFPPNAGMIIKLYLESMLGVAQQISKGHELVLTEAAELQGIAKDVYSLRPCHLGLEKYITECSSILDNTDRLKDDKVNEIQNWADRSLKSIDVRLQKVYEHAYTELFNFDNFLLFGFSSTVYETLSKISNKRGVNGPQLNLFICEAHNKVRIDDGKHIIFIDGLKYAKQIQEKNINAHITLIPDITFASILNLYHDKKWVVLYGANGITKDANCGHSAGHLSLAIIAKNYKIPVYILCDSYKIGVLKEDAQIKEREEQWLKGVSEWRSTQDDNLKLQNLRESIVPGEFIDKIITEDGVFLVSDFREYYKDHN